MRQKVVKVQVNIIEKKKVYIRAHWVLRVGVGGGGGRQQNRDNGHFVSLSTSQVITFVSSSGERKNS